MMFPQLPYEMLVMKNLSKKTDRPTQQSVVDLIVETEKQKPIKSATQLAAYIKLKLKLIYNKNYLSELRNRVRKGELRSTDERIKVGLEVKPPQILDGSLYRAIGQISIVEKAAKEIGSIDELIQVATAIQQCRKAA
jgi:hypothetical protein